MISEIVRKYVESDSEWTRSSYYPSEATGCARKIWYDKNNIEKTEKQNVDGLYRMKTGEAIHDLLQKILLKEYGRDRIEFEKPFKQDIGLSLPLSGRVDAVLDNKYILEFKSTNKYAINGIHYDGDYDSYLMQVFLYLKYNPWEIKKCIIYYYTIDDKRMVERLYTLESPEMKVISNKHLLIFQNADNKEMPFGLFDRDSFSCKYCSWVKKCKIDNSV